MFVIKSPRKSTSSPSSNDESPNIFSEVSRTKRGAKAFQIHPPSQVLVTNFQRRLTRGQAQEMEQVFQRLENMHMYGDEDDGEPKGDM